MEINLRKLKAPDLFIVSTIIGKIGLKEFKDCFQNEDLKQLIGKNTEEQIGMAIAFDIAAIVFSNLAKCEKDIYQLLANLTGLAIKEVMDLDGIDFVELLVKVIMDNKDFLKLASRFQATEK